ncbi:hypothetical protein HaLaN_09117 [Haematococcus lacustris]|uniref:Uncharacterized protein n=1 Tax=Haematococcus lacustris TaxID=44745 RepID=A0A699Z2P2_HAELA|nr:hypothetical protein HaLaN_09117 [Haematococcus lacustris]
MAFSAIQCRKNKSNEATPAVGVGDGPFALRELGSRATQYNRLNGPGQRERRAPALAFIRMCTAPYNDLVAWTQL